MLHIDQRNLPKRFAICIPLFLVGYAITQMQFGIVWRYFAWTNQTLAMIVLWAIVAWLVQQRKNRWVALLPAVFMTYICCSFLFVSDQFFGLENRTAAYLLGGAATILVTILLLLKIRRHAKGNA